MRKLSGKKFILAVILLLAASGVAFHLITTQGTEKTDDAALEAHIVPVAAKVSGYVIALNVEDNQSVNKGDVLLKIDPRDYQIALQAAQADLQSAQARLTAAQHNHASTSVSAPSNITSAQSQVNAAQAEWQNALKTLKRLQSLDDLSRSRQSLDDAVAAEKQARGALEDAKARLAAAQTAPDAIAASEAEVREIAAAVEKAKANVAQAVKNLNDTVVYAAADGKVTRRNAETGAYVEPGQQLLSLVLNDYWVVANFKETQLEHMKPGQRVDIDIDAYPGRDFAGHVDSVQAGTGARFSLFPPENATGNFVKIVQRVPVKIIFDEKPDPALGIGPGMSVTPTVHVQ